MDIGALYYSSKLNALAAEKVVLLLVEAEWNKEHIFNKIVAA